MLQFTEGVFRGRGVMIRVGYENKTGTGIVDMYLQLFFLSTNHLDWHNCIQDEFVAISQSPYISNPS